MDTLARLIVSVILMTLPGISFAVYPAGFVPNSYCYTNSSNSYSCIGPKWPSASDAAAYGCEQLKGQSATVVSVDPVPGGENGLGLTSWNVFAWNLTCVAPGTTQVTASNRVQALPDCGLNSPVTNYAPASCSGSPPAPPPVSCTNTKNIVISAYHQVPAMYLGCYAGCAYSATSVLITEYNGVNYESGTWTGLGQACSITDVGLIGGSPGNSQNVGSGGGLVPGDLANLATEQTLQQVLQTIQAGDLNSSTSSAANKALLEQIAANTLATSDSPVDVPDPDGLEDTYNAKVASTVVDANGRLPDSALNAETVDVGGTFSGVQGFIAGAACPASPSFTVMGQNYAFDMSIICGLAQALSYLVVTLAALAGAKIFIGGI